jgi:hypothetical protein
MRKAAMVLGIMSAVFGGLCLVQTLASPWMGVFIPGDFVVAVAGGLVVLVVGIVGGVLALTRSVAAGILMLATGIGGLIAAHVFPGLALFYLPIYYAFPPLIAGGIIALTARDKQPACSVHAMGLGFLGGIIQVTGVEYAIPEFDTPQARTGSARYDFGQKTRKGSVTCWWWHLDKLIA